MSRRRKKLPQEPVTTTIASLSHDGRGISRIDGKTVFIDNALPGETVRFKYKSARKKFAEGLAQEILSASGWRVKPPCLHADICGGCSLQHIDSAVQIQHKENTLLEQLEHIGGVRPETVLPPLTGPTLGYRHKARLGVKYLIKKEKVLVGFREKRSSKLADLAQCEVLHPAVGKLITPLKELLGSLSIFNKIPQIEVAVGEEGAVLIFRELQAHSKEDGEKLRAFADQHNVDICIQEGGPDSVMPLLPEKPINLSYRFPDDDIEILFGPTDFTQVNFAINRLMVRRVLALLAPQSSDRILDLFCGLGNFTLPIARYAGHVAGAEGQESLVAKAKANAEHNHIRNVAFYTLDLAQQSLPANFLKAKYNKLLIDPPRTGAQEIIRQLKLHDVETLVYVSCNPATLARDAGILVNEAGFTLKQAGVMDMFPHTSHVESIALFAPD